VIREDPVRPGLLYAGTERGVYISFDAGASWQSLQLNLPGVAVHDLLVKDRDVVIGTHSRGFWILDDVTPLRQVTDDVTWASAHLFSVTPVYRNLGARGGGDRSATRAEPCGGCHLLPEGEAGGDVTLTFRMRRVTIQRFSSQPAPGSASAGQPGTNRFTWTCA
jgi:hypothetical protein